MEEMRCSERLIGPTYMVFLGDSDAPVMTSSSEEDTQSHGERRLFANKRGRTEQAKLTRETNDSDDEISEDTTHEMVSHLRKTTTKRVGLCADSGANSVMVTSRDMVKNFVPSKKAVELADGTEIMSIGTGDFGPFKRVTVVPDLLISMPALDQQGMERSNWKRDRI